jgi:hypothetical protein
MEKEFVIYPLSLRMKALGFDEPCFGYYIETGEWAPASYPIKGTVYPSNSNLLSDWVAAPTYPQAFRWLREKGYLISFSSHSHNIHDFYIKWSPEKSILSDTYDTYEEAELNCLEKLIEIVERVNAEMTEHGVYK